MCQFCVQHGDGKAWYLQAENYVASLEDDLERREYMIDFVQGFSEKQPGRLRGLRLLDQVPAPLSSLAKKHLTAKQKKNHWGQPVPIEECEQILEFATSVVRLPCVCRTASGTPDSGYCLAVTVGPVDGTLKEAFAGYEGGPDTGAFQNLTKEETLEVLRQCEKEGLMHSVWTFGSPMIAAICNCNIESGCMAMATTVTHDLKTMWRGEYVIDFDETACTSCGACERRCPFGALSFDRKEKRLSVDLKACYGCGTCRSACSADALTLIPRAESPTMAKVW